MVEAVENHMPQVRLGLRLGLGHWLGLGLSRASHE